MAWKKLGLAVALAALLASPALAQLKHGYGKALNESESKAALFGIDMRGYSPTGKFTWRECIQPNGETLYERPDRVMKGRLLVAPTGEACFSYEDDEYSTVSCFATFKTHDGLIFQGADDYLFITTKVVTGVKSCKPNQLIG